MPYLASVPVWKQMDEAKERVCALVKGAPALAACTSSLKLTALNKAILILYLVIDNFS